jgi:hypothetical protein
LPAGISPARPWACNRSPGRGTPFRVRTLAAWRSGPGRAREDAATGAGPRTRAGAPSGSSPRPVPPARGPLPTGRAARGCPGARRGGVKAFTAPAAARCEGGLVGWRTRRPHRKRWNAWPAPTSCSTQAGDGNPTDYAPGFLGAAPLEAARPGRRRRA